MRRKIRVDLAVWWSGILALPAVYLADAVAHGTGLIPRLPSWLHSDLLSAALAAVMVGTVLRWMISPLRETFLHGWNARGEHEEKVRERGSPQGANVRYLQPAVFAASLAPAVGDTQDIPASARHRATGRAPRPR